MRTLEAESCAAANVQEFSTVQASGEVSKSAVCQELPPPPNPGFSLATEIQSVRPPEQGEVLTQTFQPIPLLSPLEVDLPPPGNKLQAIKREATTTVEMMALICVRLTEQLFFIYVSSIPFIQFCEFFN